MSASTKNAKPTFALRADGLRKSYFHQKPVQDFRVALGNLFSRQERTSFDAVADVSFTVRPGEVLGIIGKNGSGKSTLLRMLSGVTKPTAGTITIHGHLASILDIGTGFHPDLTGRENISMRAKLFGMRRTDIQAIMPEIIAFSELADFFDTPVKYYSDGMYLRLAFSLITHLKADILLFDEVLSVGDLTFQHKCLEKIRAIAQSGRTIIMVSHNVREVLDMCNRFLLLEKGRIKAMDSNPDLVMEYIDDSYKAFKKESETPEDVRQQSWQTGEKAPGNEQITLRTASVCASGEEIGSPLFMDQDLEFRIVFDKPATERAIDLAISLKDQINQEVLCTSPLRVNKYFTETRAGRYEVRCVIPGDLLNVGQYRLNIFAIEGRTDLVLMERDLLHFTIGNRHDFEYYNQELIRSAVSIAPALDWTLRVLP